MKRITIVHGLPDTNSGGSALGQSLIQVLKNCFPGIDISYMSSHKNKEVLKNAYPFISKKYPEVEIIPFPIASRGDNYIFKMKLIRNFFNIIWMIRIISSVWYLLFPVFARNISFSRIKESTIVISRGTNIFYDKSQRFSMVDFINKFSLCFPLLFAWRVGRPFIVYAQSFGPIHNFAVFYLIRFCLKRASLILPREELSQNYLIDSMNIKKDKILLVPDSVFAYNIPNSSWSKNLCEFYNLPIKKYAVFVIRELMISKEHTTNMLNEMIKTAHYLIENQFVERIVIVTQCHHFSDYWGFESDSNISQVFYESLRQKGEKFITIIDKPLNPDELIAIYGGAKYLITIRLHAAIFALLTGTPTISIAYWGFKTVGIMKSLGLEKFTIDQNNFNHILLQEKLCMIEDNYVNIVCEINKTVAISRELALQTPKCLATFLDWPST